jgi:hypothetical protein
MLVVLEAATALAAAFSNPVAAELLFVDIFKLESIQNKARWTSFRLGQCKVTLKRTILTQFEVSVQFASETNQSTTSFNCFSCSIADAEAKMLVLKKCEK